MTSKYDEGQKSKVRLICATCGQEISDKGRGNGPGIFSSESRCMCKAPEVVELKEEEKLDPRGSGAIDQSVLDNLGDKYEVLGLIGQGGMGAVYKVRDRELNETFAIKVLNPKLVDDNVSVKRFEQEVTAASNLTHANICAVYRSGMGKAGAPYLVMDYLAGVNLADILAKEGFLDVPRALDIFIQTTEAVAHAHMKGVVHRDIKPDNIIVERGKDNIELVKIVDFGIAKLLPTGSKATTNLTQTGEIFGSPLYMSPEQCVGNKLDARSDIYAMGCVMYKALTGKDPFAADNPIKTILRHINERPTHICDLKEGYEIPRDLERVIFHCLEKRPEDRYQTAEELLQDLQRVRNFKPLKFSVDPLDSREKNKAPAASQDEVSPEKLLALIIMSALLALFLCLCFFPQYLFPSSKIVTSATLKVPVPPVVKPVPPIVKDTPPPKVKSVPPVKEKKTEPPIIKVTPPPVIKVLPPQIIKVAPPPVIQVTPPPVVKTPTPVPSTDDASTRESIAKTINGNISKDELILLSPSKEDYAKYADFLKQPDTGLIRLLPRETYDGKLKIRGGGAYYSFARRDHEYNYGSDIELSRSSLSVGFAGGDYGFFTMLGNMPIAQVGLDTPGVPYMASYQPGRMDYRIFHRGVMDGDFQYIKHVPVHVGSTYALRSLNEGKTDVLVAFQIDRQDEDGSIIVPWKLLKLFPAPEWR